MTLLDIHTILHKEEQKETKRYYLETKDGTFFFDFDRFSFRNYRFQGSFYHYEAFGHWPLYLEDAISIDNSLSNEDFILFYRDEKEGNARVIIRKGANLSQKTA